MPVRTTEGFSSIATATGPEEGQGIGKGHAYGSLSGGSKAATKRPPHPLSYKGRKHVQNFNTHVAAKSAPMAKMKKKAKNGVAALREIRKYQRSTERLIPFAAFSRFVKDLCNEDTNMVEHPSGLRWQREAILALQEAAETHLVHKFEDSQLAAIHAGRITVMVKDINIALRLAGEPFATDKK